MASEHITSNRNRNHKQMLQVLAITLSFMLIEVIVAVFSKSLALLADAGHMFTDVGAITLALIAFWFANKPPTSGKTYGYYRSEILAGVINAFILVAISISIIINACQRLKDPPIIAPIPVLCAAIGGLLINLVCLRLLRPTTGKEKSLNVKAAYLEVFSDTLMSIGVIFSSLIIFFFHWHQIDAVMSLIIGFFILPRTWTLLSDCINILMEGTPQHVDLEVIKNSILAMPAVVDIHDMHIWTITSGLDAMSAHVLIAKEANIDQVLDMVTKILQDRFDIKHTTIQIEQASCQTDACS